jgi:hypothetical protein
MKPDDGDGVGLWIVGWFEQLNAAFSPRGSFMDVLIGD